MRMNGLQGYDFANTFPKRDTYLQDDQPLWFFGHRLPEESDGDQIEPQSIGGSFFWLNPSTKQAFARSDRVLEQGMCGGAVTPREDNDICVGMIEGIVPVMEEGASQAYKMLENQVAFIPLDDIVPFLRDVEVRQGSILWTGTAFSEHDMIKTV
jgi:hypothetical protein